MQPELKWTKSKIIENCLDLNAKVNSVAHSIPNNEIQKNIEFKLIELETKSRGCNLLFEGFPETKGENFTDVIENII